MRLFADIVLFMAVAMGMGVGIGFLMWRWRRHTVSPQEWSQQQRHLETQTTKLNELSGRLRVAADSSQQNGEDARRWRDMLRDLRQERDRLAAALELAQVDAVEARYQRDQLAVQLGAVQRRLAELSINQARARLSGVRVGEQPVGVPLSMEGARRIALPAPPASPVTGHGSLGGEPPTSIERPPRPASDFPHETSPGQPGDHGGQRAPGVAG